MNRYLKIIFVNAKNCLIRIMEFRSEVISWSVFSVFWIFVFLAFVNVIFGQITAISGWTKDQVLVLFTVQELFIGCMWIFILPGVLDFSKSISKGELDFMLLRPINTRFLLTFRRFEFDQYGRIIVTLILLKIFLSNLNISISLLNVVGALLIFVLGMFIFYSLFFLIATLSFWFINLFNLEDLLDSVVNAGRYPSSIYKGGLKIVFGYIIPLAFTATFPTQILLGNENPGIFISAILIAAGMFFVSHLFWNFALKRYSSASS